MGVPAGIDAFPATKIHSCVGFTRECRVTVHKWIWRKFTLAVTSLFFEEYEVIAVSLRLSRSHMSVAGVSFSPHLKNEKSQQHFAKMPVVCIKG